VKTIGEIIREHRERCGMLLREVAQLLKIDTSLLSKIETGDKRPTKEQVIQLAQIFKADERGMLVAYFSDRLVYEVREEDFAGDALKVAEQKIEYLKRSNGIF
jgi:transcriptional regulator with XRE-family HTH domain